MSLRLRPGSARQARMTALFAVLLLTPCTVSCGGRSTPEALPGCVVLDNLTEQFTATVQSQLASAPSGGIGDSSVSVGRLYSTATSAKVYGENYVRMRLSDGHLLGYANDLIEFGDGTVQAQGFYDLTNADAGQQEFIPTIGTTGVFRNKLGRFTFRTEQAGKQFSASIEMCPAGILK